MFKLIFELESEEGDFPAAPTGTPEGFPELLQARKYWREKLYQAYLPSRGNGAGGEEWLQVDFEIVSGDTGTFQFEFNEGFFDQLIAAYTQFGWPLIEKISTTIERSRWRFTKPGQELFQASRLLLLRSVAKELINLEKELSAYAQDKWSTSIDALELLKTHFSRVTASKYRIGDEKISSKLFEHFVEYDKLMRGIEASARKRKAVDKDESYVPGKNDAEYADLYRAFGAAELENKRQMGKIAEQIKKLFPAAVLALDDCFDILRKELPDLYKRHDLETHIYRKVEEARDGLKTLRAGLKREGIATKMSGQSVDESKGLEAAIAEVAMGSWKAASKVQEGAAVAGAGGLLAFGLWLLLPETGQNPVMTQPGLIREYWSEIVETNPASWRRVVCENYLHAVQNELQKQQQRNKDYALVIKIIKVVEAAIAILAFIALVVMTDGAAMPVGIALIAARLKTVNTALGLLVLVITVTELKVANDRYAEEAEKLLAVLSVQDPETLAAVGSALSRFHLFRYEVTLELAKLLVQQKLAGKLPIIEKALDMESLAYDIETLITLPSSEIVVDEDDTAEVAP